MRVVVGCEESQTVTKAFREIGVEAYSCDIQECSGSHPEWHFQEDIFELLHRERFDLGIFHPPCTFLTYAGQSSWSRVDRVMQRIDAARFFMQLWQADIPHICIENPRGVMSRVFRDPDMEIQPFWFGDSKMKRTNLWLKDLPVLRYSIQDDLFGNTKTATDKPKSYGKTVNQKTGAKRYLYDYDKVWLHRNSETNVSKERSVFFPSVAQAMAEQWTDYILKQTKVKLIRSIK